MIHVLRPAWWVAGLGVVAGCGPSGLECAVDAAGCDALDVGVLDAAALDADPDDAGLDGGHDAGFDAPAPDASAAPDAGTEPTDLHAMAIGGSGRDQVVAVDLSPVGDVVVLGRYESPTLDLGAGVVLSDGSPVTGFVAVFAWDGTVRWAATVPLAEHVAALDDGSVIVSGALSHRTESLAGHALGDVGASTVWLARFDPAGDVVWAADVAGGGDGLVPISTATRGSVWALVLDGADFTVAGAPGSTFSGGAIVSGHTESPVAETALAASGVGQLTVGVLADGELVVSGGALATTAQIGDASFAAMPDRCFVARVSLDGALRWATVSALECVPSAPASTRADGATFFGYARGDGTWGPYRYRDGRFPIFWLDVAADGSLREAANPDFDLVTESFASNDGVVFLPAGGSAPEDLFAFTSGGDALFRLDAPIWEGVARDGRFVGLGHFTGWTMVGPIRLTSRGSNDGLVCWGRYR